MSDTYTWNIQIAGETIGSLLPDSIFYTGPFPPGSPQTICEIHVENTGDLAGSVTIKLVSYPGEENERELFSKPIPLQPGGDHWESPVVNVPTVPGAWPLGVKVWGETETEPVFGGLGTMRWTLGRMELPSWFVPAVALGGLLGISYLALKK